MLIDKFYSLTPYIADFAALLSVIISGLLFFIYKNLYRPYKKDELKPRAGSYLFLCIWVIPGFAFLILFLMTLYGALRFWHWWFTP